MHQCLAEVFGDLEKMFSSLAYIDSNGVFRSTPGIGQNLITYIGLFFKLDDID